MKKFLFCLLYVLTSTITVNAQNEWIKIDYPNKNKVGMLAYYNEDEGYRILLDKDGCVIIGSQTKLYSSSCDQTLTPIAIVYYDINGKLISKYYELFDKLDDFSAGTIQSKEKQNRVYDYITKQKGSICIFALPADYDKRHPDKIEGLYFAAPCINN